MSVGQHYKYDEWMLAWDHLRRMPSQCPAQDRHFRNPVHDLMWIYSAGGRLYILPQAF